MKLYWIASGLILSVMVVCCMLNMFDVPHLVAGVCVIGLPLTVLYVAVKVVRKAWK
jgi:hypothetical protein